MRSGYYLEMMYFKLDFKMNDIWGYFLWKRVDFIRMYICIFIYEEGFVWMFINLRGGLCWRLLIG